MSAVVREDVNGGWRPTALASGLAAGATSLSVTPGGLSTWTPVVHGRIPVILNQGEANEEHLYATAVVGNTLTGLVRGQDGTADQAHDPGEPVWHGLFAKHIDTANEFLSSPTAAGQVPVSTAADTWGAPSSTLNGLTLGNPTLTSPNVGATEWGDANHAHTGLSQGGTLPGGAPSASAPGDTSSIGIAGSYATAEHRHAREGYGLLADITTSSPGDTKTQGASAAVARADHRHSREPYATGAAVLEPLGSSSAGISPAVSRGDHAHGLPAAIQPHDGLNHDYESGIAAYSMSGSPTDDVTVVFATPFANVPVMSALLFTNSNRRLDVNLTAVSETGATFRVNHMDDTPSTTSGTIHWKAEAASV